MTIPFGPLLTGYKPAPQPVILPDIIKQETPWEHLQAVYGVGMNPRERQIQRRLDTYDRNYALQNFPHAIGSGLLAAPGMVGTWPADIFGELGQSLFSPDSTKRHEASPFAALLGQGPMTQELLNNANLVAGNDPEAKMSGLGQMTGMVVAPDVVTSIASRVPGALETVTNLARLPKAPVTELPPDTKYLFAGAGRKPKLPNLKAYDPAAVYDLLKSNPEGFTVMAHDLSPHGGTNYLVGNKAFTSEGIHIPMDNPARAQEGFAKWLDLPGVKEALADPERRFGGWIDERSNKAVVDVPKVHNDYHAAFNEAVLNREKGIGHYENGQYKGWFDAVPNRGARFPANYRLAPDEEPHIAASLAPDLAGTKTREEWFNNVVRTNPRMRYMLEENPELQERWYNMAKQHQDLADAMAQRVPEQKAITDAENMTQGPHAGYRTWYRGWRDYIANALPKSLGDAVTKISAQMSAQSSPEEEAYRTLVALQAHERGENVAAALTNKNNYPKRANGKLLYKTASPSQIEKTLRALRGEPTYSQTPSPTKLFQQELKTGSYALNRLGMGQAPTIDAHMVRYYTGNGSVADLTDLERIALQQRVTNDAQRFSDYMEAKGHGRFDPDEFQALIWGHQSEYPFGAEGKAPEDWFRHHIKTNPIFADLLKKYPGLAK